MLIHEACKITHSRKSWSINAADSGRINLQRGSSASNGSSIGSLTFTEEFTDNGNNAYARIETIMLMQELKHCLMLHQELMIIQVELFSAPHQTDLHANRKTSYRFKW